MKTRTRGRLSPEQRATFVLLLFLGLGGVVLGFFSFGANIRKPFDLQVAGYQGERILPTGERDQAEMEALKNRDTDGDGIVDYDEIHVFRTSPYLADTDSDGFDDKTEIYAGEDPNCPRGKECGGAFTQTEAVAEQDISSGLVPKTSPAARLDFGAFSAVNLESVDDTESFLRGLSVEEVRQSLLQQGVPAETLDQVDDAALREMIENAIAEASAAAEEGATP